MSAKTGEAGQPRAIAKRAATLAVGAAIAAATSMGLAATTSAVRLIGVSAAGNAVLIEASEPVAYSIARPNPLTLTIDMRNVSIADARNEVRREGPIAGVRVEQASAADGQAVARVHLDLSGPSDYKVRSARNMIRVELSPSSASSARAAIGTPKQAAPVLAKAAVVSEEATPVRSATIAPATAIERVQSRRAEASTIVTLSGDGHLAPARVTESDTAPRRLILDFPNVISRAPSQIEVGGAVKKVRVALNSHRPVITRVVMEIEPTTTYRVERAGEEGRDLAVVFNQSPTANAVLVAPPEEPAARQQPEAPITLEQAMANVSSITPAAPAFSPAPSPPPAPAADPMAAMKLVAPPATRTSNPTAPPKAERSPAAAVQSPPATASSPRVLAPQSAPQGASPAPGSPVVQAPVAPSSPVSPPSPGPVPPPSGSTIGGQQKTYSGHPISLDFTGGDLRTVLRLFAEVSGLNMIIDPDVQGSVDIVLTDVPWDQALEVILRGNQLDYTVDGTIVRIAKIDTLRREQDARQALARSSAEAGTLVVRTFPLSYARAAQAAPLVRKAALSARGDVQIDERTNTLIITDLPARLDTAASLIGTLDRAEPQVEVEARIVQTSRDFARAIGVQWGLNGRVAPELGNTTDLAFPNRGSVGGRVGGQQGSASTDPRGNPVDNTGTVINLPAPAATSAIGLALGAVNGAFNLDVALTALENSGKGRILSTPRLTTQNNIQAEVSQGIQIPIQTVANNTVTVTFKDAVLILRVTPQITAANTVIMKVEIENATADFSREVNGIPPIDTQRANTQVQINDGATTVIGGIFVTREDSSSDRVPMLHRIPLFGWLFKREANSDESRELLIFITPRILKG